MKPVLVIQNCEAESPGTILNYMDEKKRDYQLIHSYDDKPLPSSSDFAGIINLGTPHSAAKYSEIGYLKEVFKLVAMTVRDNRPYLGICFGAQILARALGSTVMPNKSKEIGTYMIRLTGAGKRDALFKGFEPEFPVFHWHGDTFKLPFDSQLLAEGDECRCQAFRKGKAVGLQFHLEADPDEIPGWTEEYQAELEEVGKSADAIISDYRAKADQVKVLNYRLLDNFLNSL